MHICISSKQSRNEVGTGTARNREQEEQKVTQQHHQPPNSPPPPTWNNVKLNKHQAMALELLPE